MTVLYITVLIQSLYLSSHTEDSYHLPWPSEIPEQTAMDRSFESIVLPSSTNQPLGISFLKIGLNELNSLQNHNRKTKHLYYFRRYKNNPEKKIDFIYSHIVTGFVNVSWLGL
ncbi:hypothetical protein EPI10_030828 [Gossypium australe]|uniref:Uncharacterized protein n=1 Tax=Gossypium australe TaxID=47621 RepID=A0A5B6WYI8_9ROSI|nr:hypothetical protein EPI10_030828 [Gossypium australe]